MARPVSLLISARDMSRPLLASRSSIIKAFATERTCALFTAVPALFSIPAASEPFITLLPPTCNLLITALLAILGDTPNPVKVLRLLDPCSSDPCRDQQVT